LPAPVAASQPAELPLAPISWLARFAPIPFRLRHCYGMPKSIAPGTYT